MPDLCTSVYPMRKKTEIPLAVKAFAKEIGIPMFLILDPEGTHRSDELQTVTNEMNCLWANLAELYIGLIRESIWKDMKDSNSPPEILGLLC